MSCSSRLRASQCLTQAKKRASMAKWWKIGLIVAVIAILRPLSKQYGWDKDATVKFLGEWSDQLGVWAMPAFVGLHTITIALCLPYAVFFEAAASLLFGFFPAVLCVFSAKLLGASISFLIGRLIFRSSKSAMNWAQSNKYFHILSKGVERDGWKFVLLARFSPMPSYVINYALAATKVGFVVDFLLPTVIGCLPMILQNASIGSLAGAAVVSASGTKKSKVWSYIFPVLGIASSIAISLRIKKYSTDITVTESSSHQGPDTKKNVDSSHSSKGEKRKGSKIT